jgi:O-antigen/teichoic acid export membrane protein
MLIVSVGNLTYRVVTLALGLAAIRIGASAGWVAWTFVAGSGVYVALAWHQTSRLFGRPRFRLAVREALQLFKLSAPFFSIAALAVIYSRGAVVMLSAIATPHAVGLYAAADRIMVAVGLAPTMFNSAVYPALTRVADRSREDVRALCGRSVLLMAAGTLPLAALFSLFSAKLILLLFGPAYQEAARVLQILTWTLPIVGVQSLLGSQLIACNQQHALARARFSGVTVFIVVSPVLIWALGFRGAAWSLLISDTVLLVYYFLILRAEGATPTFSFRRRTPAVGEIKARA